MVDKRRVKKEKVGDTTTTKAMIGSGYKNEAKTSMFETDININDKNAPEKMKAIFRYESEPTKLTEIESNILDWLKKNGLPTSPTKDRMLYSILRKNHAHIKGVLAASCCLSEIEYCKSYESDQDYKNAYKSSLALVDYYGRFVFSINESTINKGKTKNINNKPRLSDSEIKELFTIFESDENKYTNENRKKTMMERKKLLIEYCKDHFGKKISARTLQGYGFKNN